MAKKLWMYYQPNSKDKKDEYGDCVIRALTKAFSMEWLEVFDALTPLSRELQVPFNCKPCYEKYITQVKGWVFKSYRVQKGHKRPTVKEFAKANKEGTYILRLAHHLVTVHNGQYFDTWDSGEHCYYGYWVKE